MKEVKLSHRIVGISSLNGFTAHNSSARGVMTMSHAAQHLVLNKSEPPMILSGLEREMAKYTFKVKTDQDCTVISVIEKFPTSGPIAYKFNPETIVIVEREDRKLDCIHVPYHRSLHQYFGFKYKLNEEAASRIYPKATLPKDLVIADSPAVTPDGYYSYGVNLNTIFMSTPDVAEDGFVVSRSALQKLNTNIYETPQIGVGREAFPVNLYGSLANHKSFPEIGDYIREDGLLMLLRSHDDDMAVSTLSVNDLQEPDMIFDRKLYTRPGVGRIVNIEVIRNESVGEIIPKPIREQLNRYWLATKHYYEKIIRVYEKYRAEYKNKYNTDVVPLSDRFHRLIVTAYAITGEVNKYDKDKTSVDLLYRKNPLDEYTVRFTIEYNICANIGFKLSGRSGDKGVIVKIVEDEHMPVDKHGNRAELITDAGSTVSRMNLGRLYEHYFSAIVVETKQRFWAKLNLGEKLPSVEGFLANVDPQALSECKQYLEGLYKLVAPAQYRWYLSLDENQKAVHLYEGLRDQFYLHMPIDGEYNPYDVVKHVEKSIYRPLRDKVMIKSESGHVYETEEPMRIAPMYVMLLEKIADSWSSVSTGKLQHFGLLSPISKTEKTQYNFRNNPVRTIGETEARIFANYCGTEAIAEMMDRSNSIFTQKMSAWNILSSDAPTNIPELVNRNVVEFGSSRPLELVKHSLICMGIDIRYQENEELPSTPD